MQRLCLISIVNSGRHFVADFLGFCNVIEKRKEGGTLVIGARGRHDWTRSRRLTGPSTSGKNVYITQCLNHIFHNCCRSTNGTISDASVLCYHITLYRHL